MRPRRIALTLGIAFAILTILELVLGEVTLGAAELLHRTTKANILHWVLGLIMLGGFFARTVAAARMALRVGGIALLVISAAGIVWADAFGASLGFDRGMPLAYNAYHAVAALIALSAGFLTATEEA